MDIIKELKKRYKTGSILFKLIFINAAVFILLGIINFFSIFGLPGISTSDWFGVPADLGELMYKPWTLITYMFVHGGFMHILFNMLWLFWLGQIFLQFITSKRLLSVYLLGGLSGAALYIAAYNLLPVFDPLGSTAIGASASVYAVVVAIAAFAPDYSLGVLFIGRVKLKYLALFMILLDIISIGGQPGEMRLNAGGHIAHLGGALFGYFFAVRLKKGKDITKGFSATMDWLFSMFKSRPKMKVTSNKYRQKPSSGTANAKAASDLDYNKKKKASQAEIDRILDKISKKGYDSLTKEEKDTLFDMSKK